MTEDTKTPRKTLSRRAMLRGATVALPTVLTLQSGAALARSSNLMGTVQYAQDAIGEGGRMQCLDTASVDGGTPTRLDLGNNPMLHVQYVGQRKYYRGNWNNSAGDWNKPVTMEKMCRDGGKFWYRNDGRWYQTAIGYNRRGIEAGFLVSATALASFASSIKVKSVF